LKKILKLLKEDKWLWKKKNWFFKRFYEHLTKTNNQFDNIERIEEINIVSYYSGKREKIIKVKYIIII
jgi:hypothetical protein